MKRLFLILMVALLLPACDLFGTEEVEEPTFEEFVNSEMDFGRTKTAVSTTDKPSIQVSAEDGYEVGVLTGDSDGEAVVVEPDARANYLLQLMVIDEYTKDENYAGEPDENGVYEAEGSAMKLIPLSEGWYCEVYAEKASDMEVFDHITIKEVEVETDTNSEQRRRNETRNSPQPR